MRPLLQVHAFAEQIGQKLAKAEQLGAEGFVDESMKMMEEVVTRMNWQCISFTLRPLI